MKKLLLLSLSVVLVFACVMLAACGDCALGHTWGEWETTTQVSCTEAGIQTRTCSVCGEKETQSFGTPAGHQSVAVSAVDATCEENGHKEGHKCSVCDAILDGMDEIAARGHKNKLVSEKSATCTEAGYTAGTKCMTCGKILSGVEEISALGHDPTEIPAKAATCTEPSYTAGSKCSRCGLVLVEPQVGEQAALGHDFDEDKLNYVTLTPCSHGCGTYKVLDSKNVYEDDFVYDFNDEKQAEIDGAYDELIALLDGTAAQISGEDFDDKFEVYDDFVSYVQYQYQVAQVLNDRDYTVETRAAFSAITEYYYDIIAKYYGLFQLIYDSSVYKDYFYKDWTQDEIDEILETAASYDATSRTEAEKITEDYEDWMAEVGGLSNADEDQKLELFNLYNKLVIANNNIATKAGYSNYMEYAYANVYDRDYTPADVANMREFVRNYIGPLVAEIADEYLAWNANYSANGGWSSDEAAWYYSTYKGYYVLRDLAEVEGDADRINAIVQSRKSLNDYYTFLSSSKFVDDQHVSFSKALSDLFENGNYFIGQNANRTAYTWYIYELELPMLLFTSEYRDSFTFVHEFGHYYQFIYNGRLSVPMDHDETQSQGNEMLYLAWLKARMPAGVDEGFEILELEQLVNMLGSVVLSTAVDEFEYLVYTGATTFNGNPIATVELSDGTKVIDYAKLYEDILYSYWDEIGTFYNTAYWSYVVFDQACYYISYAMSALPCLELYAIAGASDDGLESARDSYLKLFTFGSDDKFVETESYVGDDGETHYTTSLKDGVTYQSILNWAGLKGPFQEELYQTIQKYFSERSN